MHNVRSNFIHNSQEEDTIQTSISWWVERQHVENATERHLVVKRNEGLLCLHVPHHCISFCFLRFIYLFLERRGGREREKGETLNCQRNTDWLPLTWLQLGTWPTTQACALTRNRTGHLLLCWTMPYQLSHTGQGTRCFLFWRDSTASQRLIFNHCYTFIEFCTGMPLVYIWGHSILFVLECAFHNRLLRSCWVAVAKKVSGTFFSEMGS